VLVRLYAGATAGVVGALQGVQKHPEPGRESRGSNASQLVVFQNNAISAEHSWFGELHPESRARSTHPPADVGASD